MNFSCLPIFFKKNAFLFRDNYAASSKKGAADCRAELAFLLRLL